LPGATYGTGLAPHSTSGAKHHQRHHNSYSSVFDNLDSNEGGYKKRQDCGRVGKVGRRRVLQRQKFSGFFPGV